MKKEEAITLNLGGIKCDYCDFKDMSVPYEDYKNWLGKPCPKCGANLLTEADYKTVKRIVFITKLFNKIYSFFPHKKTKKSEDVLVGTFEFDGTGKTVFSAKTEKKEG